MATEKKQNTLENKVGALAKRVATLEKETTVLPEIKKALEQANETIQKQQASLLGFDDLIEEINVAMGNLPQPHSFRAGRLTRLNQFFPFASDGDANGDGHTSLEEALSYAAAKGPRNESERIGVLMVWNYPEVPPETEGIEGE